MPLAAIVMQNEILKFTDETSGDFVGFPANDAETAEKWTNAVKTFFDGIVAPPLVPGTTELAAAAMQGAMAGASLPNAFLPALIAGLTVFYATLVPGALPAVLVPPPAPFVPPALPPIPSPIPPAVAIGAALYAWAITGLWAVPPTPPATPVS